MSEKKGKPDEWSDSLWVAYKRYGEADVRYVQSCNRFFLAMLEQRLGETVDLILKLMSVLVRNGVVKMTRHFDITTGLPSLLDLEGAKDEVGVYRNWYAKYVTWPKDCVAGKETEKFGSTSHDVFSPWFLTACRQLAIGVLERNVSLELGVSATAGPYKVDGPIHEDAKLTLTISRDVEDYLKSGAWRIDEGPTENLYIELRRLPDESRRDYINRVQILVDLHLISGMALADRIARHPKVPLQGRPLDPTNKHEEMVVRRMFGESIPIIAGAMNDALLDKQKRPLEHPERTIRKRTTRIAEHLGFLPPSGDETS